jgi:sugar/nucleoside kinase (ribokinase family)
MHQPDAVDTAILHLAPVARETSTAWRGRADFVGLTPQGVVRTWSALGAEVGQVALDPSLLPRRCDAIVISDAERENCAWLIAAAERADGRPAPAGELALPAAPDWRGALVAVTAGAGATVLHIPGGARLVLQVPAIDRFVDDIGAGDVFAAAFFISLSDGRPPAQAAAFGNAAAAVRIGGSGADAVGKRGEIEARLRTAA